MILVVCVCVCMCVCVCVYVHYRSGTYRGGTRLVTCDLCTYYTLYCVCVITSRHSQGAAVEADIIGEQQLKRTQSGSSSWSVKRTQL